MSIAFWFYANGGRQVGPMEATKIRALVERGIIAADTLVWREGLANWTELRETELLQPDDRNQASVSGEPIADTAIEAIVSGFPKLAAKIADLPAGEKETAVLAVERSYYRLALSWGYSEDRASGWAELVMVALQREIEDQTSNF
jgi:hypothetical protein